jgi:excisionase family DNA binding protein
LSRPHVYTLATAGAIRSIKFGRAVRFDPKDVERFIRDHRREGATPKDAA